MYRENSNFRGIRIQIIDTNNRSFVKSWAHDSYGDDLSFRPNVIRVANSKKAHVGMEIGRETIMVRAIVPMFDGDEYVGMLEFLQGVGSVSRDFENEQKYYLMVFSPEGLNIANNALNNNKVGPYTVTNNNWFNERVMGFAKTLDYDALMKDGYTINENYFATYSPVTHEDGTVIAYNIVGEPIDLLNNRVNQALAIANSFLFIIAVMVILMIIFLLLVVIQYVIKPINRLKEVSKDLYEGEGDLRKRLPINSQDEIGKASEYVNGFISKIEDLIANTKQSSNENATISHELSTTAAEVGNNVEKSVLVIDEASAKANHIQEDIEESIKVAQESKKEIVEATANLNKARDEIAALTSSVKQSAMVEVELAERISRLSAEADQVKTVLEVISDIADQTNLLALNAAIEAARAGEHGRGFAVVADEVRKLAERTQKSLVEINSTINIIVQSITEASEAMNKNSEDIQHLNDMAQTVEQNIDDAVEIVNKAATVTDKMVADFERTGKNINEIVNQVKKINEISSKNARSVEEIASAASHLNAMTNELNNKLEEFKTK